ncbi:hypothetical protein B296_00010411 [Ensete ventricosum]|uniref:Uncharacterized protein n=1 Tax=Ensete ventricosum TaxID=4639 RepID=A0A426Z2V9_ENSVE|nr:hypothetical protein B296_00010411 [Ensete ventricosum]
MVDLSALFISSSEEHSYTCFARTGCRAPRRYFPANRPSVHIGDDPEMADHLSTRGSSLSTDFNHVMIEVTYLSGPVWSSTPHRSWMVYPRSGGLLELHYPLSLFNRGPRGAPRSVCRWLEGRFPEVLP